MSGLVFQDVTWSSWLQESSYRVGFAAIDAYGWRVMQLMILSGQHHPALVGAMQQTLAPHVTTILKNLPKGEKLVFDPRSLRAVSV